MYKYLFGPVPSRRLGLSLGIDLVPHKVCSLNCVYCECGPTTRLTLQRKEYILFAKVKEELLRFFAHSPDPDYFTFSGSGEPTLNSRMGELVCFIREQKPQIPLAVLTNGTLLFNKEVRQEILKADVVLPSLDAASDDVFQKINRPVPGFKLNDYIRGIADFRKEYPGKIWLEVLIIPGYNDGTEHLESLKKAFFMINPDKIQLNTLDRPGVLQDIRAASRAELNNIVNFWNLPNVEIISAPASRKKINAYRKDIESAILETISRRPCTLEDLSAALGLHINEMNKYLDVLEAENKVENKHHDRGIFYRIKKHCTLNQVKQP